MKAVIQISNKTDQAYTLTENSPIMVGRDDDCDIQFNFDFISR